MKHIVPVDVESFPNAFHSKRFVGPHTSIESCIIIGTKVPPGCAGPQLHTHPVDQFFFTVRGTTNFQIGTEIFVIKPHTFILIPAGTPHCNWNTSAEPEVHIEVLVPAPPEGEPTIIPAVPRHVPDAKSLIRPFNRDEFKSIGNGFTMNSFATRGNGSPHARLYMAEVEAGGGGPPLHYHDFDQFYYILEGAMDVQIGNRHMTANAGDVVVLPAGTLHTNTNPGAVTEKHLALLVPEPETGTRADYTVAILPKGKHGF
jgi:mannose-6-phosphate isomerase-like protein (cupin superfamily)